MRTIDDLGELRGKTVLLRSDLNVPLNDAGEITDDGRVRASVPTIRKLSEAGARVVVCAHLGRPKGAPEEKYSLRPVADRLAELLDQPVLFATDTVGESANETVDRLNDGDVALLENLRFNPGETSKDEAERGEFADQLAHLADLYVSDGFGVVHRKQASVYDVAQRLPHAAGTEAVAKALVDATADGAITVVGGGDSAAAVRQLGFADSDFSHISTGGGASLEFLEGKTLPGLEVLES